MQRTLTPACAGIGLRMPHIDEILQLPEQSLWLELLADNWLSNGGLSAYYCEALAERFTLSVHGVGLSLGGSQDFDPAYLQAIKHLLSRSKALIYSEHLSFSTTQSRYIPDLLPLPYTEQALKHLVARVRTVQDYLGQQLLVENVSSYFEYTEDAMSEAEFLATLAQEADCGILLDVNNLYVNQANLGRDALQALDSLPADRIWQCHLGGFEDRGDYLLDAHNNRVCDTVWTLYEKALTKFGPLPTMIEWDKSIPELSVLMDERSKAQSIIEQHREVAA